MRCLLFLCLLLTACSEHSAPPAGPAADSARPDGTEVDTAGLADDTANLGVNTPAPNGYYRTILPCDGCPGIEHTVHFDPEGAYRLQEVRLGGARTVERRRGFWRPDNGLLHLLEGGKEVAQYRWQGDTLMYENGGRSYALAAAPAAGDNPNWAKGTGITWRGVGTEPFWSVEIAGEKEVRFQLAEWAAPRSFRYQRPAVTPDSVVYRLGPDTARLRLVIYPEFCSDGMSDFTYGHTLRAEWKRQVLKGCAEEIVKRQTSNVKAD